MQKKTRVLNVCDVFSRDLEQQQQLVFAIVPNLVPRTASRASPSVLEIKKCCIAILDPSRSSLQSHVGDSSRRSAVACFPRSSSPLSALYVPRRRSPLPSTTRFSNLGCSSSRTDLASNSSAPPTEHVTLPPSDCDEGSFLDESFATLRELPGVPPSLVAIVPANPGSLPQQSPSADEPDPRTYPQTWLRVSERLRYHERV